MFQDQSSWLANLVIHFFLSLTLFYKFKCYFQDMLKLIWTYLKAGGLVSFVVFVICCLIFVTLKVCKIYKIIEIAVVK